MSSLSETVAIGQNVTSHICIKFPDFANARTIVSLNCIDPVTGRQFCSFLSMKIVSAGRNVDGLMSEYTYKLMKPTYNNLTDPIYTSSVTFDLGIITNTSYFNFSTNK